MSVGHLRLDEQHKILVDTINQLANAHVLNNHHAVEMIIDEMLSYSSSPPPPTPSRRGTVCGSQMIGR